MHSRNRIFFLPILFLLVGFLVIYPALNLPSLSELFQPTRKADTDKSSIKIWASQRSGLYYCPDSKLYGKITPGVYMLQSDAIQNGYRPAGNEMCR